MPSRNLLEMNYRIVFGCCKVPVQVPRVCLSGGPLPKLQDFCGKESKRERELYIKQMLRDSQKISVKLLLLILE